MFIRVLRHVMSQDGRNTICGHVLGVVRGDARCHVGIDWTHRKAPVEPGEAECDACTRRVRVPRISS